MHIIYTPELRTDTNTHILTQMPISKRTYTHKNAIYVSICMGVYMRIRMRLYVTTYLQKRKPTVNTFT